MLDTVVTVVIFAVLAVFVYKVLTAWWYHRTEAKYQAELRRRLREQVLNRPYEPRFGYAPRKHR